MLRGAVQTDREAMRLPRQVHCSRSHWRRQDDAAVMVNSTTDTGELCATLRAGVKP
jgi:hypothetical protein